MIARKEEILFVSHAADRSGAPVLLLEILKQFKKQSDLPFQILVIRRGPLSDEFAALAPTHTWEHSIQLSSSRWVRLLQKMRESILQKSRHQRILKQFNSVKLVFSNTICNGAFHQAILPKGVKIITYVHELEAAINIATTKEQLATVIEHTSLFLAGSRAVKNNLAIKHDVAPDKIKVLYSSLPVLKRDKGMFCHQNELARLNLRIPPEALIVGVAAPNEWRKGFDLFAPLLKAFYKMYPTSKVHFIWLGINPEAISYFRDMYDFKKYELDDCAHFIPHGTNYLQVMSMFDIHLLLSREDPYPLVVLDAATFNTPTLCFSNAGGTPEFVEFDSGVVVDYGDLMGLATAIGKLEEDPDMRARLGSNAGEKVAKRHNQEEAVKEIIDSIKTFM